MKLLLWTILFSPVLLALSCTTLNTREEHADNRTESKLLLYQQALEEIEKSPEESCLAFERLSNEQDFNLAILAHLRLVTTCADSKTLSDAEYEQLQEEKPWLAALALEVQKVKSEREQNSKKLSEIYFKMALRSAIPREKVQFYETSLKLIADSKDQDSTLMQQEIQSRIEKLAPRFVQEPKLEDYHRVGIDWINQRKFADGRAWLQKVVDHPKSSAEEKYLALRSIRNSWKTEQKRSEHIEAARQLATWSKNKVSAQRQYEAYLILARALWTVGNRKEAEKYLNEVSKNLKGKIRMDEVYFVRGKMAEEIQDFESAIKHYTEAQPGLLPQSSYYDRILFAKAWSLRKLKRWPEALQELKQLKENTQSVFEVHKYQYWLARSYQNTEQQELANDLYQDLREKDPIGFYGLLSYREQNKEIPALDYEALSQSTLIRPNSVDTETHQLIRNLIFVGEKKLLENYLKSHVSDMHLKRDEDPETWLYYLKAYAASGLYMPLFSEIGSLPVDMRNSLLAKYPELLFPRKYTSQVQKWSEKFEINPEMILSIMRQESAFNPMARSPADAMGLMQVLPSVAKRFSEKIGQEFEHFEDLYNIELNIASGSAVLSELKGKYNGQFVLMSAAYNANETAIRGWLNTRMQEDPIEFIEDIPYEETRGYIKLVLRNFVFYTRLNQPKKSVAFPHWALEGLQEFRDIVKN